MEIDPLTATIIHLAKYRDGSSSQRYILQADKTNAMFGDSFTGAIRISGVGFWGGRISDITVDNFGEDVKNVKLDLLMMYMHHKQNVCKVYFKFLISWGQIRPQ